MFLPQSDNLLVSVPKKAETTQSGLYIPNVDKPTQVVEGIVEAIGPGRTNTAGERFPMNVKPNYKVWFNRSLALEIELAGEKFLVVSETNILGFFPPAE